MNKPFAIVTGASSGIGEQTVDLLSRLGYSILAGIRTAADANRLRTKYGQKIFPLFLDVTLDEQLNTAFKEAEQIIGNHSLVGIINNAGGVVSGAVLYVPLDEWKLQFDINFFGVIRTTQTFFPL